MIFNALIIVALVPLALRGVKTAPLRRGAAAAQPADLRRSAGLSCRSSASSSSTCFWPRRGLRDVMDSRFVRHRRVLSAHGAHRRCLSRDRRRDRRSGVFRRPEAASSSATARPSARRCSGRPSRSRSYFWSRPSATAPQPTTGRPRAARITVRRTRRLTMSRRANRGAARRGSGNTTPVPVDLVTASAAGSIRTSAGRGRYQVAAWRGLVACDVRCAALVAAATQRQLSDLGRAARECAGAQSRARRSTEARQIDKHGLAEGRPNPDELLAHVRRRGTGEARAAAHFFWRVGRRRQDIRHARGGARLARRGRDASSVTSSRTVGVETER